MQCVERVLKRFQMTPKERLFVQTIAGSMPDNRHFRLETMRVDPLMEPKRRAGFAIPCNVLKARVLLDAPFTYIDNEEQVTGRLRLVSTPNRSPNNALYFLLHDAPKRPATRRMWIRLAPFHGRSYSWRKNQEKFWEISDHAKIKLGVHYAGMQVKRGLHGRVYATIAVPHIVAGCGNGFD